MFSNEPGTLLNHVIKVLLEVESYEEETTSKVYAVHFAYWSPQLKQLALQIAKPTVLRTNLIIMAFDQAPLMRVLVSLGSLTATLPGPMRSLLFSISSFASISSSIWSIKSKVSAYAPGISLISLSLKEALVRGSG